MTGDVRAKALPDVPTFTEAGLKDTDAPAGSPVAVSAMLWALPDVTAVEIVEVADAPGVTVAADGLAEREKSLTPVAGVSTTSSYSVKVGSPVKLSSRLVSVRV